MKRFILTLTLAAAIWGSVSISKTASAQEILLEGPLAGEPAVRKLIQYRNMRVSIGPQVGMTILNDYMHNILLGGRLEFNPFDWLGIGGVIYYSFNITTKLTDHIAEAQNIGGEETVPSASNWPSYTGSRNFKYQVGRLKGVYLGQLSLVPFRGKMSIFEKLFVGIDWEIFVGGGAVQFEERKYCSLANENCGDYLNSDGTLKTGSDIESYRAERASRVQGAFTVGSGFGAYFNDWFAVHLEYRATPFRWDAGGTDEAGQSGSQWNQVTEDDSTHWEYISGTKDGDYPDGAINKDDRKWNANQSIAIGLLFHFPFKPSIAK